MISFITVTWNHLSFIKNWYATLKQYKPVGEYEIVVVDNASTDGTVQFLKGCGDVRLIQNSRNEGEGKGFNIAMKEARGDYVYKSDPDVYFRGPFHEYMIKYFEDPEVGIVIGHNPGWEERRRDSKPYDEVYLVVGAFFCLSKKTIEKAGYWEGALPYSGAEFDYTARVRMKNLRVVRALVPDGASSHVLHCGRFQTVDKNLIPKEFGPIQDEAWKKLWLTGIGGCYWYILRGWLDKTDLYKLDQKNIRQFYPNVDLEKGEGYLGSWGRD